jgi:hypothetical protein
MDTSLMKSVKGSLMKEIPNLTSIVHEERSASCLPNDVKHSMLDFGSRITGWESLESVADSGHSEEFREPKNTDILQVWYLSIDTHSIFLHVEFEDELPISVLKRQGKSF